MKHERGCCCTTIDHLGVTAGKTTILEDVTFSLHCGQLTVVVGPNGAGKTTLIQALLGEMRHTGGLQFHDPNGTERNLRIGYVPQSLHIDPNSPVSVLDFCGAMSSERPAFLGAGHKARQRVERELKLFGAAELIDRRLCDLSGGELQRVMLALATNPAPELLILDEPVSGIDQGGLQVFYERLDALKREKDMAILLVSHDLQTVAAYADRMILLDKTVLCEGTPQKVMASAAFQEAFNFYAPGRNG